MADKKSKWSKNVQGQFYVDDQCITCNACVVEAPKFFVIDDSEGRAFVYLQPKTDKEIKECLNALESCPVEAIGSDGDD
ncbi:MAG: ferredoxin [Bacteriovorax sp.]|nr:ferredoxin [Bacteriovorax sp.]